MSLRTAVLAIVLGLAGSAAHAQPYMVAAGGAQFQIGSGQLLPLQKATTGGTMMSPVGTGTMFPPLLIPVNPAAYKRVVRQTNGPDPRQLTLLPQVLKRNAPGPRIRGIWRYGKKTFQVQTNLAFTVPAPAVGSPMLKKTGRTGASVTTLPGLPINPKASIRYTKTAAQFGGPAQASVAYASPVKRWANAGASKLPCKHPVFGGADAGCVAVPVLSRPASLVAAGGPVGFTATTPGGPVPPFMSQWAIAVSVPNTTGLVAASVNIGASHILTNAATSAGFPWTTGMITLSQPSAAGTPEVFTITGMDSRMGGIGTIALVSGALSNRKTTGPNANRGWMRFSLPEPGAMLGAVAALATLAVCHRLATRR
jgi:hypothetical protein